MEDIYVCSPGEYAIVNYGGSDKDFSKNGLVVSVVGIKNGKVSVRSLANEEVKTVTLSVHPWEVLDCNEHHEDEVGDENDDEEYEEGPVTPKAFLSDLSLRAHIKKYPLLMRVRAMLGTLEFNPSAFADSNEVMSAVQYLQKQLLTCSSQPLYVIGSYFLARLHVAMLQYIEATTVCEHLLRLDQLPTADRKLLLLLKAQIHNQSGDKQMECESFQQFCTMDSSNSHVSSRLLCLMSAEQSLNVLANLESLVGQNPYCVSSALALAQCYYSLGESDKCRSVLTKVGGEMRLMNEWQSRSEAMQMHTSVARLMITCGVEWKCVLVCLLRAINIGRQVSPKALSDLSFIKCRVMFDAVSLLGETLESIGHQLKRSGNVSSGYFRSAHMLYRLCLSSRASDSESNDAVLAGPLQVNNRFLQTESQSKYHFHIVRMSKAKGKATAVEEAPVVVEIVRGSGEFTLSDGSTYNGDYKIVSDVKVRSGKGVWTSGPERYEGEWENDLMNGHGEYSFSSGAVYRGNFKDNLFAGEGEYIYPDGAFYRGSWTANKMHGKGTYIDAQKMEFNGDFVNGIYSTGSSFRAQKSG